MIFLYLRVDVVIGVIWMWLDFFVGYKKLVSFCFGFWKFFFLVGFI